MPAVPPTGTWSRAAVLVAVAALLLSCGGKIAARRTGEKGAALYNQGKYAEALPLLAKAVEGGERNGTLLYQLGFCRLLVDKKDEERQAAWNEAEPLLNKEIAAPNGATLERLYYLTVISSARNEFDRMTQYARQGIEQYEKGPSANALSGDDWFRLGRLHDLLTEASAAEAAYRLAVSAYAKASVSNPAYHALALVRVADLNYEAERYVEAAGQYDEARKLQPATDQIRPFRHAVALLAAGRFDDAIARFGEDRDEVTINESQYGADLARKAKEVAPPVEADRDGSRIAGMPEPALADRVRQAAKDLRAARVKNSLRPGDPLPAEVIDSQRRFVALLRELLLRTKVIQDFCLQENIADLVRR